MADYSDLEARRLMDMYAADPVGTHQQISQELAAAGYDTGDPRVAEMYEAWKYDQDLAAYDATIDAIVSNPANADINPNRLHQYVAAADGDFDRALELYRSDTAAMLNDYRADPHAAPPVAGGAPVDYRAQGMSPQDALHRSIEDATRAALARRGR